MKESNLIDMFGLSGNPEEDARLDDLLFRLEWGTSPERPANSKETDLSSSIITAAVAQSSNNGLFRPRKGGKGMAELRERLMRYRRGLLYTNNPFGRSQS
jgi:hypothetical protein